MEKRCESGRAYDVGICEHMQCYIETWLTTGSPTGGGIP